MGKFLLAVLAVAALADAASAACHRERFRFRLRTRAVVQQCAPAPAVPVVPLPMPPAPKVDPVPVSGMTVTLRTSDGKEVKQQIRSLRAYPAVVRWGDRYFVRTGGVTQDGYTETRVEPVLDRK